MRSPWKIWTAYVACLVVVAVAVGGLSLRALEAERAEEEGRRQAALEENVRLALWRMDSALAPFVAFESSRPHAAYQALTEVAAPAAVRRGRAPQPVGTIIPSPMLVVPPPQVALYFQFDPDGNLGSPQIPEGPVRERLVPKFVAADQIDARAGRLARLREIIGGESLFAGLPVPIEPDPVQQQQLQVAQLNSGGTLNFNGPIEQNSGNPDEQARNPRIRGDNEFQARSQYAQTNNSAIGNRILSQLAESQPDDDLRAAVMTPIVAGGELLLARKIVVKGCTWVQGCWLDWNVVNAELLAGISDLLPNADLRIIDAADDDLGARRLASLPVRIEPGALDLAVASTDISPVRMSLVLAWCALLLAAAAVAVLLRGVVTLSERRADFVSAVTHELRTPLTTFRMYAEMLAGDMLPDEARRKQYVATLHTEAERLTHLVENVLAYARLERGGLGNRVQAVSAGELLDRSAGRLADRARQAGLELTVDAPEAARETVVRADPLAVEQVLVNLVDNACKYAASAKDRSLCLSAMRSDGRLQLTLRDHGPGLSAEQRRRLFKPFRKSAAQAAQSAPGVGLGLALCRRLARDMSGDLRYDETVTDGATFVLSLPCAEG